MLLIEQSLSLRSRQPGGFVQPAGDQSLDHDRYWLAKMPSLGLRCVPEFQWSTEKHIEKQLKSCRIPVTPSPDVMSYNAVIDACARTGDVTRPHLKQLNDLVVLVLFAAVPTFAELS